MIKRSFVIKATKFKSLPILKADLKTLILFSLIICGLILGISFAGKLSNDDNSFLSTLISSYASSCREFSIFKLILNCFCFSLLPVFIVFILGFCAVGVPLIWIIALIYGAFCGAIIGCLFIKNGILGLVYAICINIPCYAITAATLIRCCCESIRASVSLFGCFCGQTIPVKGGSSLKEYCLFFAVITVPLFIAAIVKAVSFTLFSGFFSFI